MAGLGARSWGSTAAGGAGPAATRVYPPDWLARYPSAVSCWYASTTTPRETPRSAASAREGGRLDPRGSRPARIASRIEVSICRCSGTCPSCLSMTSSAESVLVLGINLDLISRTDSCQARAVTTS